MLRPATPLTILLLAAFALLVISILSTPIVKGIPLASYDGVNFGVFGYCKGNSCSKVEIGYNTGALHSFISLLLHTQMLTLPSRPLQCRTDEDLRPTR
jgi:hypothetical protein